MTDDVTNDQPLSSDSYWQRSQAPLQALLFLLPLVLFYELGTAALTIESVRQSLGMGPFGELSDYLKARQHVLVFFRLFGVSGPYLPGLAVAAVLLGWHMALRDRWRVYPRLYGWMWIEAMVLTMPLFIFALILARQSALTASDNGEAQLHYLDNILLSVGAGIYEEMVFRLIGIALLHWLLVDRIGMPPRWGATVTIAVTSIAFSLYHFGPGNPVQLGLFVFYTIAGAYFAGIYLLRGFGIVVAVHALYDIFAVVLDLQNRYGR
jgi:membrane protease YdiL (CAAX protease family)